MAIDPRFIVTSDLEELFRDKDSGLPLAGGIVTFYSDLNRTTKKPVYQLTGSPPNYTYAVLQNPVVLSDVGTFQDSLGNNIVPYYFPYQGTPTSSNGTVELYYITVESSGGVPEFTRQAWPNFSSEDASNNSLGDKNYIPNGQFLAHNQIVSATEPPVTTIAFGSVNLASQAIAQGGWSFRHSSGGTSVFNNSFTTLLGGISGLNDFPRYAFNFSCTSFNASDQIRDLTISWPDVNKFSAGSPPGSQDYTFYFSGMSNDSNTYVFDIYLIYYFGTGGSPSDPIQTLLSTVSISPGYSSFTVHIAGFPANAGTLGSNNDDYVAIALRGPASSWNIQVTDFALLLGNVAVTAFPTQTNAEMLDEGVAGWMPTPAANGDDLYLPLVLTPTGMTFDHSEIGSIIADTTDSITGNHLLCDGSAYKTSDYSALGIPYSRLQSRIFVSSINAPKWGTGTAFIDVESFSVSQSILILSTNKLGAQTNPADSTDATKLTGFTFSNTAPNINTGTAGFNYVAHANLLSVVTLIGNFTTGTLTNSLFSAGTSGITVFTNFTDGLAGTRFAANFVSRTAVQFGNGAGTGKYFLFSNGATHFYAWFKTATETDPAPGGTGIQINLNLSMTTYETANIIARVLSGYQTNILTTVGASSITGGGGSWFSFNSNSTKSVVWYKIAGSGTQPTVVGVNDYIEVDLPLGTENSDQVGLATKLAINNFYFAVPDLRGMFLRGLDVNAIFDVDNNFRWSMSNTLSTNVNSGAFEYDSYTKHNHPGSVVDAIDGAGNATPLAARQDNVISDSIPLTIASDGQTETRPVNMNVNWYIKY